MAPNLEIMTELRLGLAGDFQAESRQEKKRLFWEIVDGANKVSKTEAPAKNQVVGWPPVCSYRKRAIASNKKESCAVDDSSKSFIKVSMDGAIYLRKIELDAQVGYGELAMAIEKLFGCAGIGLTEENNSSEYMLIYEDKDGDWMLVGDVPWKMFLGSCKRLRVTKRSDASKETLLDFCSRNKLHCMYCGCCTGHAKEGTGTVRISSLVESSGPGWKSFVI